MFENVKNISIIGIARSGVSSAIFLKQKNFNVFISDYSFISEDSEFIQLLKKNQIEYETGKHTLNKILNSDLIVLSPGVPLNSNIVIEIQKAKKKYIGEIELAYQFCNKEAKIIAITGSNGKSTTTTLTGEIFKNAGFHTIVAGNIGFPFINFVNEIKSNSIVVLELSSFQIDTLFSFHPYISIILNVYPNHLDRYSSFEDYRNSKLGLIKNQSINDYLVINSNLKNFIQKPINKIFINYSENNFVNMNIKDYLEYSINQRTGKINFNNLNLLGKHNYENICAAVAAALIFNINENVIKKTVENFKGLEHRLEFVRKIKNVSFYNDSKSTTPMATLTALNAFNNNIILILGGRNKGLDFSILANIIKEKVKYVILFGEAKEIILKELNLKENYFICDTLFEVVNKAYNLAKENDIVLFSPACASFDMFKISKIEEKNLKN